MTGTGILQVTGKAISVASSTGMIGIEKASEIIRRVMAMERSTITMTKNTD